MKIFITVLIVLFVFAGSYLFSVAPRMSKREKCKKFITSYAHRGLHNIREGIPENSTAAFRRAVENGFAIELDVQLSSDKVIMVFHDTSLLRVCGIDKKLCELKAEELCKTPLLGTEWTIPTFDELLSVVDGKVPLLIELKGEEKSSELCEYVCKRLDSYKGDFCIESFNPLFIKHIRKLRPQFIRGQLVTNLRRDKWDGNKLIGFTTSNLLLNYLSRPDFVAFNKKYKNDFSVVVATKLFKSSAFVWTIKNDEEYKYYKGREISPIFEGFIPKK